MADLGAFRSAFEGKDLDSLMSHFSASAVIHSPFTSKPLEGQEMVRVVLGIILETIDKPKYVNELASPDGTRALVVKGSVLDLEIDVIDLIRFDTQGKIDDFTVFVRPRKSGEALFSQVAPRVAKALKTIGA